MKGSKCASCPPNATCKDGRTYTCNKNYTPRSNTCVTIASTKKSTQDKIIDGSKYVAKEGATSAAIGAAKGAAVGTGAAPGAGTAAGAGAGAIAGLQTGVGIAVTDKITGGAISDAKQKALEEAKRFIHKVF